MLEAKAVQMLRTSYAVTSNSFKQGRLRDNGRPFTSDPGLIKAVTIGEGINNTLIKDNNPEEMAVVVISRRKAEAMIPLVNQYFQTFADPRIFYATDSVYVLAHTDTTSETRSKTRIVVNKAKKEQELLALYKKREGDLLYSTSSIHFVQAGKLSIPMALLTKIRIGDWVNNIPGNFIPNMDYALGMSVTDGINHGYIKPHQTLKLEVISFDYGVNKELIKYQRINQSQKAMLQTNYEAYIPFDDCYRFIQSISLGIIPDVLFDSFKQVRRKIYSQTIRPE